MALLWSEGFDQKSTWADFNRYPTFYSDGSGGGATLTINSTGSYFGTKCARGVGLFQFGIFLYHRYGMIQYAKALDGGTIRMAFWYRNNYGKNNNAFYFVTFAGADGSSGGFQLSTTTGAVIASRYGDNSIIASGSTNLIDDQWHWVELHYTFKASASGSVAAWVDGVQQFNSTSLTTSSVSLSGATLAYVYQYFLCGGSHSNQSFGGSGIYAGSFGNGRTDVDDVIIWDDQGSAFNSFPLGQRRIYSVVPNSDNTVAYTRSAGANSYALVNDTSTKTDTDYVDGSSVGNADLYGLTSISGWTPGTINAIAVKMNSYGPGPGLRTARANIKLSGTTVNGTTFAPSPIYGFSFDPFYTKPGGGSWGLSDFASLLIGPEVVS